MAPTATSCPWEKGQDSSASLGIAVPVSAGTALQSSQALGPPDCTLTMMATHPSSQSTSALRLVLLGPRDTSPVPRQGLSEQTGITWGDTWSV